MIRISTRCPACAAAVGGRATRGGLTYPLTCAACKADFVFHILTNSTSLVMRPLGPADLARPVPPPPPASPPDPATLPDAPRLPPPERRPDPSTASFLGFDPDPVAESGVAEFSTHAVAASPTDSIARPVPPPTQDMPPLDPPAPPPPARADDGFAWVDPPDDESMFGPRRPPPAPPVTGPTGDWAPVEQLPPPLPPEPRPAPPPAAGRGRMWVFLAAVALVTAVAVGVTAAVLIFALKWGSPPPDPAAAPCGPAAARSS